MPHQFTEHLRLLGSGLADFSIVMALMSDAQLDRVRSVKDDIMTHEDRAQHHHRAGPYRLPEGLDPFCHHTLY